MAMTQDSKLWLKRPCGPGQAGVSVQREGPGQGGVITRLGTYVIW